MFSEEQNGVVKLLGSYSKQRTRKNVAPFFFFEVERWWKGGWIWIKKMRIYFLVV